jgi:osmotically-inducible protein OsmY
MNDREKEYLMKKNLLFLLCFSFAYLGAASFDSQASVKSEERIENGKLLNQILSRIKERFQSFNVNVFVEEGVVTLRGTVQSKEDKSTMESEVQNMTGVKKVINELKVKK